MHLADLFRAPESAWRLVGMVEKCNSREYRLALDRPVKIWRAVVVRFYGHGAASEQMPPVFNVGMDLRFLLVARPGLAPGRRLGLGRRQ